ncbi:unnamed protein product [Symbiodinium natans]|uniref:JmjC domain-containing protein n=1 Tax=Symbiodinium natans TaxID=878477 RepID=A0A812KG30_9DINO|nr:unnamed protein product [Symbiodinium natans]
MGALSKQIWSGTAPIAKDCLTVLTNSFQQLPVSSCREMLLEQAGSRQVEYKRVAQGEVGIAAATLTHVMCELLPTSCHESSVLLMDENVVAATSLVDAVLEAAPPYLRDDLFGEFPRMLQPSQLCLVAGGRGARSDLHIDPLSWTGWNCLLEGRKAWRFYPDTPQNTEAFRPLGRPFGIGKGGAGSAQLCTIGTGWRSEVDLFAQLTTHSRLNDKVPDGSASFQADFGRFPHARGCTVCLDHVQEAGETLIFPGHWWHQTYHLSPTLGFAGQVLNSENLRQVLGHIISWCGLEARDEVAWGQEPRALIAQVLGEAIDSF